MIFEVLIVFFATLVSSTVLVAIIIKLSHRNSWYDRTNDRKIHSGNVPRLGGIGFALVFVAAAAAVISLAREPDSASRFLPCLAGIVIIVVFGVWDDFRPMKPLNKMMVQTLAALCVLVPGYAFSRIFYFDGGLLARLPWLGYPVTLLWIVGLTNALNLIDGVDGLAGGIASIIALTFGLIFFQSAQAPSATLLCIGLLGAVAGFLLFNAPFPRAKIFMGDGGSQFLGFTLALLPLLGEQGTAASLPVSHAAALFIIPIFDTTAAVWRRLRDKKRIDFPDRAHIHHKLLNLGCSPRKTTGVLLGLQVLISAQVFVSLHMNAKSPPLSLAILAAAYLSALSFFAALHFLNRRAVLNGNAEPEPR